MNQPTVSSEIEPSGSAGSWLRVAQVLILALVEHRRTERGEQPDTIGQDTPDPMNTIEEFVAGLGMPQPFSIVAANAELSPIEAQVLAVLLGCEVDPKLQRLVAYLKSTATLPRPTLGLVSELFELVGSESDALGCLAPDRALRRSALIDVIPEGTFTEHAVMVHPSVIWAVLGDASTDPELPLDVELLDLETGEAGPEHFGPGLVVVSGGDRRLRRLAGVAHAPGSRFLVAAAPESASAWAAVVRAATVSGRGVIVEVDDELSAIGRRWIQRADHLAWVISSSMELPVAALPRRPWVEVVATEREPDDREWAAALGDGTPRHHRLSHEQLHTVSSVLPAVGHDLDAAVRRLVSGKMERLARRIRPTRGWDDIVLSPDRREMLASIVERYRHSDKVYDEWGFSASPSRGVVALFSGQSGTGKTMATEILAGELGLDVFKLELSAVVSKYIGETEKNLEEIFDAASAGNMVLFFDEADALFGKRSEVRDARDRYANIEVSYLLQRLERYNGMVVLATNFEKNVDEAFMRRIHVRIEFPMPGPAERRTIWERNFPSTAPIQDVDLDWLADRFEIAGGAIRNASVHAGFLAAAAGKPITMETAVLGVAREFRKMGRLLKAEQFGEFFAVASGVTNTAQ